MPPGATRAIASLNTDAKETEAGTQTEKVRIKLHDKQAALVSLAKIFGLLTGDSPGVSVVVNDAENVELSTLSIEELRVGVRLMASKAGQSGDVLPTFELPAVESADSHGPHGERSELPFDRSSDAGSEGEQEGDP